MRSLTAEVAAWVLLGKPGSAGAGGTVQVKGGAGDGAGAAGGAVSLVGGEAVAATGASIGGAGGAASLTGAAGAGTATGTGGAGGDVTITGGAGGTASGAGTGGAGGSVVLEPGAGGSHTGGTAGIAGIVRVGGTNPVPLALNLSRATIANGGTVTDAETRGGVLYQDASGGAVTMTTRTGTQLAAALPDLAVGNAIPLYLCSNHGSNTSTLSGGTDVTLVGSGAVTQLGGQFLLVKTGATTFDLLRVG
jgi:hypothetical protein